MDLVYAMAGPGAGAGGAAHPGGGIGGALLPLILMFMVFYFLLIRPQQKKAKQHRDFLDALNKGDEILTSGGMYGKITGITENVVTLEIADKVRVKIQKGNIACLKPKITGEQTG